MIYLGVYILGVFLGLLLLSRFWVFEEGEWEFDDCGEAFEVDEEYHKDRIVLMSLFWPLTLLSCIMVLIVRIPLEIVNYLIEKWHG